MDAWADYLQVAEAHSHLKKAKIEPLKFFELLIESLSPGISATKAFSLSSLRQLNSRLALTPCLRPSAIRPCSARIASFIREVFSCTDLWRGRSSGTVTTSMVCLFPVLLTVNAYL